MTNRFLALALLFCVPSARAQGCLDPATGFGLPGTDGVVRCSAVFDDGTGPALYVGGDFRTAGDAVSRGIARWDGQRWSGLQGGVYSNAATGAVVFAMAAVGSKLYVGGIFEAAGGVSAPYLAVWDGQSWSSIQNGPNGTVRALASDQGQVLVGGSFTSLGALPCTAAASLDPLTGAWTTFGPELTGTVRAFARLNTAPGSQLFAGGTVKIPSSGQSSEALFYWDGQHWVRPGGGIILGAGAASPIVETLAVHDDGNGPEMWVGGSFSAVGGTPAACLAAWNGTSWRTPVQQISSGSRINSLVTHDFGTGTGLFVGGSFTSLAWQPLAYLARWDGTVMQSTGPALDGAVWSMTAFQGSIALAGTFGHDGVAHRDNVALYDGTSTSPVGRGNGFSGRVRDLCVHDDGSGPRLHAVAHVADFDTYEVDHLQRWTGAEWEPLPTGTGPLDLFAIHSHDEGLGNGPALFVGGVFQSIGGVAANGIARWQAGAWSALAPIGIQSIQVMASFDEGAGPRLFAGGALGAGAPSPFLARWDGTQWSSVGGGVNSGVTEMVTHDDGTGPALYVGGYFTIAGTTPARSIARWDGQNWSALGAGVSPGILAMASFDDGTGPALYVAGDFATAGGIPARAVARWKDGTWSALGQGLADSGLRVNDLAVFDDGIKARLYAVGNFQVPGWPGFVHGFARWNGTAWDQIEDGFTSANPAPMASPFPQTLQAFDDGHGPALFVGGLFTSLGGVVTSSIARYAPAAGNGTMVCVGDGSGTGCPCANNSPLGAEQGCLNSLGMAGELRFTGCFRLSEESAVLRTQQLPDGPCLYLQAAVTAAGSLGVTFGDGLLCGSAPFDRLAVRFNVGGSSSIPPAGQKLSALCGIIGPDTRIYQVWYRDAAPYCSSAAYNLTNGVGANWVP